jgi:hypothetical protein
MHGERIKIFIYINSLNAELNSICHLLALLEAHHILHVSRIRVNAFRSIPNHIIDCKKYYWKARSQRQCKSVSELHPGCYGNNSYRLVCSL